MAHDLRIIPYTRDISFAFILKYRMRIQSKPRFIFVMMNENVLSVRILEHKLNVSVFETVDLVFLE